MAKPLSSLTTNDKIKLVENGSPAQYMIVNQGKPSAPYDDSCDGTWVLRRDIFETHQWHSSSVNDYASSTMHSYLNNTFLNRFDAAIKNAIKQVKIPYGVGNSSSTVYSGSSGLTCKVFLLSSYEVGRTTSNSGDLPVDGTCLTYFTAGTSTDANNKRIAYLNGTAVIWWLRSPVTVNSTRAWTVNSGGDFSSSDCSNSCGVRPALVLPSTIMVSDTPDADGCYTIEWDYLGSKGIGDTVKIEVDGTPREFLVVNQGRPSDLYDASCDGTWVLMEDCYEARQWHSSNVNDYANSDIHKFLNSTFLEHIDATVRAIIKQVKIPYAKGQSTETIYSGSNGLSAKAFLLSGLEVGFEHSHLDSGTLDGDSLPDDGTCLSYFIAGTSIAANDKRIVIINGEAQAWWSRSPCITDSILVCGVGPYGKKSGYYPSPRFYCRPALILPPDIPVKSDGSIILNEPPAAPGSINIPTTINGGSSITLSWAASSDVDGNLAGYKLERRVNGGAWSQIYQSTATSYTDTITFGWQSVAYRVKAYDSEGAESGYCTSETMSVFNNTPPTAPPSISVPETPIGGKLLVISWGTSTDAENNLSGYELERSVAGGAWAQVYKGSALTYTDAITKGWATVAYRVRATDAKGATSNYTTSPTRTVDNNTAPTITSPSSGDLGTKAEGFAVSYTVDDADGDTLTVVETMDGTTKRTYTSTNGTANSYDVTGTYFQTLLNGLHTMAATVTDPGGKSAALSLTWTKTVHACEISLAQPMETDAAITMAVISVSRSVPDDAIFQVLLTNNGKDPEPVWEDATNSVKVGLNYLFTNTTAVNGFAFNFKVIASQGPSGQGGWIGSIGGAFQ